MHVDLSDDERIALVGLLAGLIERDPFPESGRVQQLRRILTKLRVGSTNVSARDDAGEPETTEPADVDEAEALGFGADFLSDDPAPRGASRPRTRSRSEPGR